MRFLAAVLTLLLAPGLAAAGPDRSERPLPRPVIESAAEAGIPTVEKVVAASEASSLRPRARPRRVERRAARKERRRRVQERRNRRAGIPSSRGSVCGDPSIRGVSIPQVRGRIAACGIADPVRITAVDGVALSQPATLDCTTAKALKTWVSKAVKPAIGKTGGGVSSLKVTAHYACRTRNNQPGGKVSEHGKGRAIDISAFNLRDGSSITVLKGWGRRKEGRALRKMHKAACGTFGTVLGPQSDRFHKDHFHLDTARYRSGNYCR